MNEEATSKGETINVAGLLHSLDHLRLDHELVVTAFKVTHELQEWFLERLADETAILPSLSVRTDSVAILFGDLCIWDSAYPGEYPDDAILTRDLCLRNYKRMLEDLLIPFGPRALPLTDPQKDALLQATMRYELALKQIRESGHNLDRTAQWMQHIAAHALQPDLVPPGPRPADSPWPWPSGVAGAICPHCNFAPIQGYDREPCNCPRCGRDISVKPPANVRVNIAPAKETGRFSSQRPNVANTGKSEPGRRERLAQAIADDEAREEVLRDEAADEVLADLAAETAREVQAEEIRQEELAAENEWLEHD